MALPPGLLDKLVCPGADHAPLVLVESGATSVLECTACESQFPIQDGAIPVLLIDEAKPGPRGVGIPA